MKRLLLPVLLLAVACEKKEEEAAPAPTATRTAPFHSVSAIIGTAPPPSASTVPSAKPLAGIPPIEAECTKDSDCAATFFDDACCNQCAPRIGKKSWAKKIDVFCAAPDRKNPDCKPRACGFVLGKPACNAGMCGFAR